jgi:hypothetical protein
VQGWHRRIKLTENLTNEVVDKKVSPGVNYFDDLTMRSLGGGMDNQVPKDLNSTLFRERSMSMHMSYELMAFG